jgi:hypothetical protein
MGTAVDNSSSLTATDGAWCAAQRDGAWTILAAPGWRLVGLIHEGRLPADIRARIAIALASLRRRPFIGNGPVCLELHPDHPQLLRPVPAE